MASRTHFIRETGSPAANAQTFLKPAAKNADMTMAFGADRVASTNDSA
jgi:hypothetical protein